MCGITNGTLGKAEIRARIGYFNYLQFNDCVYNPAGDKCDDYIDLERLKNVSEQEMKDLLSSHKSEELADLIIQLFNNADEV